MRSTQNAPNEGSAACVPANDMQVFDSALREADIAGGGLLSVIEAAIQTPVMQRYIYEPLLNLKLKILRYILVARLL